MSKNTPGPWVLVHYKPEISGVNVRWDIESSTRFSIAGAQSQEHIGPDSILKDECLANARLIAAAPELLEALREAADYTRHPDYDWPVDFSRQVRAIIAKATGEQA